VNAVPGRELLTWLISVRACRPEKLDIVFGVFGVLIFPQDQGDQRRAFANYLGSGHPVTTAGLMLSAGLLVWLVKLWRPFGYGCLEIGFCGSEHPLHTKGADYRAPFFEMQRLMSSGDFRR
jgi:hypothetical protein